jgi:hypothetical protein
MTSRVWSGAIHVIASEAKQSMLPHKKKESIASLTLAMTWRELA